MALNIKVVLIENEVGNRKGCLEIHVGLYYLKQEQDLIDTTTGKTNYNSDTVSPCISRQFAAFCQFLHLWFSAPFYSKNQELKAYSSFFNNKIPRLNASQY